MSMRDIHESHLQKIVAYTVLCCYNAVNLLTNIHNRHPTAHPLGWGMGCLLWIQHLIDILPQFLCLFMSYPVIMVSVIMALNCNYFQCQLTKLPPNLWHGLVIISHRKQRDVIPYRCLNLRLLVKEASGTCFNIEIPVLPVSIAQTFVS